MQRLRGKRAPSSVAEACAPTNGHEMPITNNKVTENGHSEDKQHAGHELITDEPELNEECYEFSPEFDNELDNDRINNKRDLSSDSFRSTTSSSSVSSNPPNNNTTNSGNSLLPPLNRANPLRQSFTQRNCWVRSSLRGERRRSP